MLINGPSISFKLKINKKLFLKGGKVWWIANKYGGGRYLFNILILFWDFLAFTGPDFLKRCWWLKSKNGDRDTQYAKKWKRTTLLVRGRMFTK